MRLSETPLIWVVGLLRLSHAAFEAQIYLSDSAQAASAKPPSISPNTARLLLAQRLGLAQYHELGDIAESELGILNNYGEDQEPLFAEQKAALPKLLILEGIQHPGDLIPASDQPNLLIPSPPTSEATQHLAKTLQSQTSHQYGDLVSTRSTVQYISSLRDLSRTDTSYKSLLSTLLPLIKHHLSTPGATILITPPFKHTSPSSTYGTYTPLHPRSAPEEVLSPPSPLSAQQANPPTSNQNQETYQPLPHGVLKICHPNLESAISATNNCSGHGVAYKRSSKGGQAKLPEDCFACRCSATVTHDGEGGRRKTVQWGGPACQKKDVSTPFWLLAGITIFLVSVVSWGIGLLVSIGQEELPGVIGAGVAGPRAQK